MSKSDNIHASGGITSDHLTPASHAGDPRPATGVTTQLDVGFPVERELPLPVKLRSVERATARDSFRSFGINE